VTTKGTKRSGFFGPAFVSFIFFVSFGVVQSAARQQAPALQFEVATVRVNQSGGGRGSHLAVPASGQLTIANVTVSALIQDAYDVQLTSLVANMPDWARSQRVDVVAKAAPGTPVPALQGMLRPLLAEYFKLTVRRETREMDALALVSTNPGKAGPKMRKSDTACDAAVGTSGGFARAAAADRSGPCGILPGGAGRIVARGLDMAGLADLLAPNPNKPVIDRTGLAGRFDIDFAYTPDAFSAAAIAQRPNATVPPGVDPNGPPLATALREQLGLRLEPVRAPVDVLVITNLEPL
jgi:uncharacterized protein (TIGR03435 family)